MHPMIPSRICTQRKHCNANHEKLGEVKLHLPVFIYVRYVSQRYEVKSLCHYHHGNSDGEGNEMLLLKTSLSFAQAGGPEDLK